MRVARRAGHRARRPPGRVRRGVAVTVIAAIGLAVVAVVVAWAAGSTGRHDPAEPARQAGVAAATPAPARPEASAADNSAAEPTGSSGRAARVDPAATAARPTGPAVSDGRPQPATMDIPALGLRGLPVQPYPGQTDDRAGSALQDRGIAASPHGPAGGVGPGGIGNYQVTAHRNTAGGPLFLLPRLAHGDTVEIVTEQHRYVYEITSTRQTSFRSARSLQEQRAAVPGNPGASPTRAMMTVSTCLTQEDDAAGNSWRDELGNPEHRVDKLGVLVASSPRSGDARPGRSEQDGVP